MCEFQNDEFSRAHNCHADFYNHESLKDVLSGHGLT